MSAKFFVMRDAGTETKSTICENARKLRKKVGAGRAFGHQTKLEKTSNS